MNVYLLGAGASRHAGYPLARDLGHHLADWIRRLPDGHDDRSQLRLLEETFGTLDHFEDIWADLASGGPKSAALERSRRGFLLTTLQSAVCYSFRAIGVRAAPLYDRLAKIVKPGDCLITFNYDLALERSLAARRLWSPGTGYGFRTSNTLPDSPTTILKLHGSINWRNVVSGGAQGYTAVSSLLGQRPVLLYPCDAAVIGFPDFADELRPARWDELSAGVELVMPEARKRFFTETPFGEERRPFWDFLWQQAETAVSQADSLAVIGYSLPEADERARELILGNSNKDTLLTVCCGGDTTSLTQLFVNHGFTNLRRLQDPTFEGFLEAASTPV